MQPGRHPAEMRTITTVKKRITARTFARAATAVAATAATAAGVEYGVRDGNGVDDELGIGNGFLT